MGLGVGPVLRFGVESGVGVGVIEPMADAAKHRPLAPPLEFGAAAACEDWFLTGGEQSLMGSSFWS